MNDIFTPIIVKDKVRVEPKYLNAKIEGYMLLQLKKMFEGKCSRHGYIKHDSIKILSKEHGKINDASLNGDIIYDISFEALICNPQVNSVIPAIVVNTNQWGILAEASINVNGNKIPILEIIVAKRDKDYSHIKIGNQINIIVKGKKIELNDTKMIIMGIIEENSSSSLITKNAEDVVNNDDNLEDEEETDDIDNRSETSSESSSSSDDKTVSEEEDTEEEYETEDEVEDDEDPEETIDSSDGEY
jgi:DNA-directed RNA polymerase subunit E'/Rpb7